MGLNSFINLVNDLTMRTKILLLSLLLMFLAGSISAQNEINPKLVNPYQTSNGPLLVIDTRKMIQISNFTTDDLSAMKQAIIVLEKSNKEKSETITKQQDEIAKLQQANKEMDANFRSLQKTIAQMQKSIDAIEKKLPK